MQAWVTNTYQAAPAAKMAIQYMLALLDLNQCLKRLQVLKLRAGH